MIPNESIQHFILTYTSVAIIFMLIAIGCLDYIF